MPASMSDPFARLLDEIQGSRREERDAHVRLRPVGNPGDRAQQGELVSRGFRILQYYVTEKRQCTGAVIGEADGKLNPVHLRSPQAILRFDAALDECSVPSRQRFYLGPGDFVHCARRIGGAHAKRDGEYASRIQQPDKPAKGARSVPGRNVLPDA